MSTHSNASSARLAGDAVGSCVNVSHVSNIPESSQTANSADDSCIEKDFEALFLSTLEVYVQTPIEVEQQLQIIKAAATAEELYAPVACALSILSAETYRTLTDNERHDVQTSHGVEPSPGVDPTNEPHITFIDHHGSAPTHYPKPTVCDAHSVPHILGVRDGHSYPLHPLVLFSHTGVPYHRVDTFVVAALSGKSARKRAMDCAHRHLLARPDHPCFLVLAVHPSGYQVLLYGQFGETASPYAPWDAQLSLLKAYLHTLYVPRADIAPLTDPTLSWYFEPDAPLRPGAPPNWRIRCRVGTPEEVVLERGEMLAAGAVWRHRTVVFDARDVVGRLAVVKETYCRVGDSVREDRLLRQVHARGDVPGVVRLRLSEVVEQGGEALQCRSVEKLRLVMWDRGVPLEQARSVNDLLCCFYDVLEVHRMLLKRNVLHRDMSKFNFLMYPLWAKGLRRKTIDNMPPFIKDLLGDVVRPPEEREAACLVIDFDSATLHRPLAARIEELERRVGSPTYAARAVSAGSWIMNESTIKGVPMPTLEGEAKRRYQQRHAASSRYAAYSGAEGLCHGGKSGAAQKLDPCAGSETFHSHIHRPEHDVESIYWSMLCVLIRVRPTSFPREKYAQGILQETWQVLNSHSLPGTDELDPDFDDSRHVILERYCLKTWKSLFPPEMEDVATLMHDISSHVCSEYAAWDWTAGAYIEDHLHEALQRLIFQYLWDHRNADIPLDPGYLRPTNPPPATPHAAPRRRMESVGCNPDGSYMLVAPPDSIGDLGGLKRQLAQQGGPYYKLRKGADGLSIPGTS